jgi:delta 1-pyrroline-5-carboxylate dehydrogenase
MAEPIAQAFAKRGYLTRMYVPLGELLPGMGYLVRRLLENTSNESFLRHTFFEHSEVANLLRDPEITGILPEEATSDLSELTSPSNLTLGGVQEDTVVVNLDY